MPLAATCASDVRAHRTTMSNARPMARHFNPASSARRWSQGVASLSLACFASPEQKIETTDPLPIPARRALLETIWAGPERNPLALCALCLAFGRPFPCLQQGSQMWYCAFAGMLVAVLLAHVCVDPASAQWSESSGGFDHWNPDSHGGTRCIPEPQIMCEVALHRLLLLHFGDSEYRYPEVGFVCCRFRIQ